MKKLRHSLQRLKRLEVISIQSKRPLKIKINNTNRKLKLALQIGMRF